MAEPSRKLRGTGVAAGSLPFHKSRMLTVLVYMPTEGGATLYCLYGGEKD